MTRDVIDGSLCGAPEDEQKRVMESFTKKHSQLIKGAAICLLLYHHLFGTEQDIVENGLRLRFLSVHQMANTGAAARICVYLFAFVSAYGWTVLYGKEVIRGTAASSDAPGKTREFLKDRWLRLMCPFWSCYAFSFLLSIFIFTYALRRYVPCPVLYAALDFLGIGDLFGTPMLAGIWWYMCFAQIALLLIPVLVKGVDDLGYAILPLVYLLIRFSGEGIVSRYGGAYYQYAVVLALGVLAARKDMFGCIQEGLTKAAQGNFILRFLSRGFFLICLCVGLLILFLDHKYIAPEDPYRLFGAVCAAAAFLLILSVRFMPRIPWVDRTLLFFGKHSGNLFLLHGFLLVRFQHALYASGSPLISWCTLMGGSLVMSFMLEAFRKAMGRCLTRLL